MQASQFEIWKLTQRTLEGAGVPDGHDREGAFAVQWLCGHGFPGFEMFGKLDTENAGAWRLALDDEMTLNASGRPVVSLGADIMDYCSAVAVREGMFEITVRAMRGPAFLMAFAARRCLNTGVCRLQWSARDGVGYEVTVAGPETIWIDGGPELCDVSTTTDVTIMFDCDGAALRAGEGAPVGYLLNPEKLKARREKCLAEGIPVGSDLWDRMQAAARSVLVPATEQSRELGAGGGDAND